MPTPRSTEKSQDDENADIKCGSNSQDLSNVKGPLDTDDSTQLESKALQSASASVSVDSKNGMPCVPFSATFGKSEKLRGRKLEQFRLSLDSKTLLKRRMSDGEQHLRRRARSSEGFMLRNNRIEFFEEDSHFEGSRKNEVGRRKTHNYKSPRQNKQSELYLYDERQKVRRRSVIPMEHPFKIIWDVSTVILSIAHSYLTHMAIRDRSFEASPFISFCQAWFLVDILLNFFTERKTGTGEIISDHRRIVARYLTSWFAVDILSLIPWEVLYVKPLIDIQNRRGFFKKSFFRSKAVVRVTRHLRGKHFRWFGTVAKHTKHHGIGAQRLLRLIIKYVPKYIMFLRNMKGVVAMRILRFVHWSRRSFKNIESKTSDATGKNMKSSRGDTNRSSAERDGGSDAWKKQSFEIVHDWAKIDDDGVPL
eukprot:CAMPEP_0116086768 /NCGR_PEP_ID=MMETSP0327-20121206/5024_1 /TAXON_ID=44447 /ORGANISM="Pseudo-nitzschia delicatissima, Strain B596" /LENGTH=420 /DNA_ID=CAMNT_0003577827 /DNA_START=155 /DNA_END=1417 /DNA_ORIENTATION=-